MNGMQMLLDALGVNVAETKAFVENLPLVVKRIQETQLRTEMKQDQIIRMNEAICEKLGIEIDFVSPFESMVRSAINHGLDSGGNSHG